MSASVPPGLGDDGVPAWGRRLTVLCPACGLATHRHRTLDFDGVNTYRLQAGPGPVGAVDGQESRTERAWIALMPGDFPACFFADDKVYHLAGGIAWLGPHHRDYGNARVAHDACCPGRHPSQPTTSRGASELWQAMRMRLTHARSGPG